jgi:hypothetical protein
MRAFGGNQAGELAAAGDQSEAGGADRQQRAHLLLVIGVVQQHEHAPLGQQAAVQAHLSLQTGRNPLRRDPECVKEAADGLLWIERRSGGVESPQVHVQLPVGEAVGDPASPVHGQGGLANPGGPADRADRRDAARLGRLVKQSV